MVRKIKSGSHLPYKFAWFSLDDSDNDPIQFVSYLIEAFLIPLINELARSVTRIFFVLDDYHRIQNQVIGDILSYLITHLPPTTHMVIPTREDLNLLSHECGGNIICLNSGHMIYVLLLMRSESF